MTAEPRTQHEYGAREIDAARRVLVDLGQVLGSWFSDSIVVVGGWVPDLLLPEADEPHIGSIDVDLALDANKLGDGRYAEIVRLLLDTGRYEKTDEPFRLRAKVDLSDGKPAIVVDVDFLGANAGQGVLVLRARGVARPGHDRAVGRQDGAVGLDRATVRDQAIHEHGPCRTCARLSRVGIDGSVRRPSTRRPVSGGHLDRRGIR